MMIKRISFSLTALILFLPGCGLWQKSDDKPKKKGVLSEINIALTDGRRREAESRFFDFDTDVGEFFLMEDEATVAHVDVEQQPVAGPQEKTYSWVAEQDAPAHLCKEIYFDFDKYCVRTDQEAVVEFNKEMVERFLTESSDKDIVRIDGHSCSSAGSRVYNLALSERRAKIIFDKLVELGIPKEKLKIVAWGQERPAQDEQGQQVVGNRKQQWRNRRVELHTA